jgi:hypothetical protein
MSDVERIFDRFIDAFADDLLEIARAYIDVEVSRALAIAERSNLKLDRAQLRAQNKARRLAAKAEQKAVRQRKREAERQARLAAKEQAKAESLAEKEQRRLEHDRLKQERLALKQELEAERRRLREASRKRPARQLPLDFDGLRAPKPRRAAPAVNAPPQLFVHKRRRDGQIEKLARNDAAVAPATNGAASVTNGVATAPPEASATAE